jgi:CHAT domain
VAPKPLSLPQAQKLLSPNEALLLFHVSETGNFVWAVTPDRVEWRKIDLSLAQLNDDVRKLRAGLETVGMPRSLAQAFDLDLAYSLYSALLGPVEPLLADKAHLIVVNSGPLTSLPLHLLVTQKPSIKPSSQDPNSAYRSTAWLMRWHAVTVLPSVANLKARGERVAAPDPFFGFGDPDFAQTPGRPGGSRARGARP